MTNEAQGERWRWKWFEEYKVWGLVSGRGHEAHFPPYDVKAADRYKQMEPECEFLNDLEQRLTAAEAERDAVANKLNWLRQQVQQYWIWAQRLHYSTHNFAALHGFFRGMASKAGESLDALNIDVGQDANLKRLAEWNAADKRAKAAESKAEALEQRLADAQAATDAANDGWSRESARTLALTEEVLSLETTRLLLQKETRFESVDCPDPACKERGQCHAADQGETTCVIYSASQVLSGWRDRLVAAEASRELAREVEIALQEKLGTAESRLTIVEGQRNRLRELALRSGVWSSELDRAMSLETDRDREMP